ncbi:MAG TPA: GDSL family lipase, partial [Ruminococcaceae bacterium]|nr:GDSL family lipase [Oscillospiraceae bacterium]
MKIIEKLNAKQDIYGEKPVTIAFLGDSVTQGCFECYIKEDGKIETVFDYKSAYSTRLR